MLSSLSSLMDIFILSVGCSDVFKTSLIERSVKILSESFSLSINILLALVILAFLSAS